MTAREGIVLADPKGVDRCPGMVMSVYGDVYL